MKNESKSVFSNLIWRFAEKILARLVSLVISIILARLLSPDDYGTVSLVMVFIVILDVFVNSGMGTALIQKKDADDLDFSTIFFFNIGWCLLIYLILFILAPFVAAFYRDDQITLLTRVAGLVILISGVKNILHAYVSRTMQFRLFFFATLIGTITSGVVGVWMAFTGFGAWALIAQNLVNAVVDTVVLWLALDWRPKKIFSVERLKKLFNFGSKLFVANLLETMFNNLRTLIIGRVYSKAELAYYEKGQNWPKILIDTINTSMDSVLLPTLSAEQDNKKKVKDILRKSICVSGYVIWPLMIGLMAIAEPLVRVVLTDKWLPSVPFLQLACLVYAFWPIHTANLNAIQAIGRSDVFLKLEITKKVIGIVALVVTVPISVSAMAVSYTLTAPIFAMINMWPNRRFFEYTIWEQITDICPPIIMSAGMYLITRCVLFFDIGDVLTIILQILIGAVAYITMSVLFRVETFRFLLGLVKNKKQH